jgi:hypothetical protein
LDATGPVADKYASATTQLAYTVIYQRRNKTMADLILERVRDRLMAAGLVHTQAEFCEQWLGKSECYIRTLRFNDLEPSAEALATLSSRLGYYALELAKRSDATSSHWSVEFGELRKQTQAALEVRMRERWQRVCAG